VPSSPTRNLPLRAAVMAVAASLVTGAAPAVAAPAWDYGLPEEMYEQTCQSIGGGGGYFEELGTSVRTGMLVDPAAIPKVGDTFYGGVMIAAVGGCTDKAAIPEVVPPLGVELAISPANPVRCHYTLPDGSDTPIAGGCPQSLKPGTQGGFSLAPYGDPANAWVGIGKIPGTPALTRPRLEILYLEFPLRASRPLAGLPGGPTCPDRAAQRGPCTRERAGDFLQVAVKVFARGGVPTLTSAIGLVVDQAAGAPSPASTGGGATTPAAGGGLERARFLRAPGSLRIRAALKGIPVRIAVPADDATVTAMLRARRVGRIAVARRSGVRAGLLRLRLKPTRGAARKLRRVRGVVATLRVTVKIPGRPAAVETARIRLRR
jgi:hypothetical protein